MRTELMYYLIDQAEYESPVPSTIIEAIGVLHDDNGDEVKAPTWKDYGDMDLNRLGGAKNVELEDGSKVWTVREQYVGQWSDDFISSNSSKIYHADHVKSMIKKSEIE